MGLCLWIASCSFSPRYEKPLLPIPSQYKENRKWIAANPKLAQSTERFPWWTLFHDNVLNKLEQRIVCNNNLKVVFGRYQEALSIAQTIRSQKYPSIELIGTVSRTHESDDFNKEPVFSKLNYNTFFLAPILNYEVDTWGRIKNAVVASDALARASAYDLAAIDLSLHAQLAMAYFQLQGNEESKKVIDAMVVAYEKALKITRQRNRGGIVPKIDVDQAIFLLENAKKQALETRLTHAQQEHAIAVLIGEIPSNFHLAPKDSTSIKFVKLAPDLPSTLLERRPDIAAAEQRAYSANASIGIARAAFFPRFNLLFLVGSESLSLADLFTAKSLIWSLGPFTDLAFIKPGLKQVLFDGYKLRALLKQAKADYYQSINEYKETVLTAFREVEDALVAIRLLDEQYVRQSLSTSAAQRALDQANFRYRGGLTTFLDVIISENETLQSQLELINIRTRRHVVMVQLIAALGGGWHAMPQAL